jgi:hypothetical protein
MTIIAAILLRLSIGAANARRALRRSPRMYDAPVFALPAGCAPGSFIRVWGGGAGGMSGVHIISRNPGDGS